MTIGERLKAARGDKTQEQVAKDNEISVSSVAMYETDQRTPRDEIKLRLSEYFGIPIGVLFFGE